MSVRFIFVRALYLYTVFSCPIVHIQGELSEGERRPISCYLGQKKSELFTETQMEEDNLYCVDQTEMDTISPSFSLPK